MDQRTVYVECQEVFEEILLAKFKAHQIELVMYDDVEKFPKHNDPNMNFNYPFTSRKNNIYSFVIKNLTTDYFDDEFIL